MIVTAKHRHGSAAASCVAALACAASVATAQMAGAAATDRVFIQAMPPECGMAGGAVFAGAEAGSPAVIATAPLASATFAAGTPRVVTDAPYSAVGRSETVTTLADGNRIVRSNTLRYYRDSRGRTRTEYTLSALGPIALQGTRTIVVIEDPVAAKRFVLHPDMKLATEMPASGCVQRASGPSLEAVPFPGPPMPGAPNTIVFNAAVQPPESTALPERTVNGLRAMGRRSEFSIPAGDIGNELPITMRSETWYSPDLQVVVSAVHRDPLVGETTYQLENIVRREPDAKLFVIPADYARPKLPAKPRRTN